MPVQQTEKPPLSLIHISEPTRPLYISYAVFCLKKRVTQPKGAKREEIESATLNSLTCLKSYELRLSLSAFKFRVAFLFVALAS